MNNSQVPSINPRHCHPETPSKGCGGKWLQGRNWLNCSESGKKGDRRLQTLNVKKCEINLLPLAYFLTNHFRRIHWKKKEEVLPEGAYITPTMPRSDRWGSGMPSQWRLRWLPVWERSLCVFAGDKGQCAFQVIVVQALTSHHQISCHPPA